MRTNDTAHKRIYTLLSCLHKTGILPYTMIIAFSVAAESCSGALWEESPAAVPIEDSLEVKLRSTVNGTTDTADVFIFREDETLETYQRLTISDGSVTIFSTNGEKTLAAVLNYPGGRYEWVGVNNKRNILMMTADIRRDNPQKPVMSTLCNLDPGLDRNLILISEPMLSEIKISSIRCDFKDKKYSNCKLTDVKIYLTNVNSNCELFKEQGFNPTDIINSCRLCITDLEAMEHPGIIFREIEEAIGNEPLKSGISLWCYPNDIITENGGSRFTRLVIEGKIGSVTWFYPININRDGTGQGIGRHCCYSYDITIHGTGVSDPEIPASSEMVSFDCTEMPWDERDEQVMHF